MILADLHMHTCYSHGHNTPFEMHAAARSKGLGIIGFTEHSPRPAGYDYTREYREKLSRHLPDYVREVCALRKQPGSCRVLFGMEIDWLDGEDEFIAKACSAYDFDYLIGSVHFLGHWGFDDGNETWLAASPDECEKWYVEYFKTWHKMLASGYFQIAAHPDLIKIFSVRNFHHWLATSHARELVEECLKTLLASGMAMEISSAGLRKACGEIYPAPEIMAIAADLQVPITFASDAHQAEDIGGDFPSLAEYARSFGYHTHVVYEHGRQTSLPF